MIDTKTCAELGWNREHAEAFGSRQLFPPLGARVKLTYLDNRMRISTEGYIRQMVFPMSSGRMEIQFEFECDGKITQQETANKLGKYVRLEWDIRAGSSAVSRTYPVVVFNLIQEGDAIDLGGGRLVSGRDRNILNCYVILQDETYDETYAAIPMSIEDETRVEPPVSVIVPADMPVGRAQTLATRPKRYPRLIQF